VRRHLTLTDGLGLGTFTWKGTRDLLGYALGVITRVRLLRRADGYYAPFAIDAERQVVEPSGKASGHWDARSTVALQGTSRCRGAPQGLQPAASGKRTAVGGHVL
jgi:hypothetical protein